jgi:hypothetical protein
MDNTSAHCIYTGHAPHNLEAYDQTLNSTFTYTHLFHIITRPQRGFMVGFSDPSHVTICKILSFISCSIIVSTEDTIDADLPGPGVPNPC